MSLPALPADIASVVAAALAEDFGDGDLTASLIDPATRATAHVVAREPATLCGCAWFDETFRQIDRSRDRRLARARFRRASRPTPWSARSKAPRAAS